MRLIRCTLKVLREIGIKPTDAAASPSGPGELGDWYANLIRIERRKCLLFTNEKTLYTFLIPKVLKRNVLNIREEFLTHLAYNLQYEGFGLNAIQRVRREYQEIALARTENRSVLGSMNEFAFQYEFFIHRADGLDAVKILAVNKEINRTPMSPLKYKYPIDLLHEALA